MRPLARSSLPFFDSPTPSPSLAASSAAPTPPRTPLALTPSTALVDSATIVQPAIAGRPVSLSASVLLHGGSGDSVRAVGAGSLERHELGTARAGHSVASVDLEGHGEGVEVVCGAGGSSMAASGARRHQRYSTYTTECLDELRTADDGTLSAWTTGLEGPQPLSTSSTHPVSEATLTPPSPHVPTSDSWTSLGSFTCLETPALARTPHSSPSTAATTTSRSSCSRSVFSPSRWRRARTSQGGSSSSPAPPTPPRPRPSLPEPTSASPYSTLAAALPATSRTPPRVVRFAPLAPRSTSPSRPSSNRPLAPSPPEPDWHVVPSRLRSDPNAQGQGHGAPPPREPGLWARWTAPRPVVRAWERGDEGLLTTPRASSSRASAGGRTGGRERGGASGLSWGEQVRIELDRAARAAAREAEDEEEPPG